MALDTRRWMRFNEEQWEQLKQQAEQLGTDRTGYIKLIISLDASAQIISKLKDEK